MEQSKFYQIKNVTEHEYTLVGCDGDVITRPIRDVDKSASAFIIQDAKDGDVLQLGDVTAIFQEYVGNAHCMCYCSVCDGEFVIPSQDDADNIYGCHNALPATKEQCDLLFQKMKEEGYEWDAEKKELKKIKKKTAEWSEEDEQIILSIEQVMNCASLLNIVPEKIDKIKSWLKSLKERLT
jgi:hypothetical protein